MRYIAFYLLYAAVVIRGLTWYGPTPLWWLSVIALAFYGVLLIVDQWVYARRALLDSRIARIYPFAYFAVQTCLVLTLLLLPPMPDFGAMLFIPLSMQAVLWFERRAGFVWIALFVVLMAGPLLAGWQSGVSVRALILLYGTSCVLVGFNANLIMRTEAAHVENLRLYDELKSTNRQLLDYSAQVEDLAVAQERNHLARELHDSVTQTVFSMMLTTQSARVLWDKDVGRVAAQLDRLQELAQSAVGEIQLLVAQLRPVSLADEGLVAALRRLCDERKARDGLQARLDVISDKPLSQLLTVGLYRIVQEALNNVTRHAGTLRATVRLDLDSAHPQVEVSDEGIGFAVDAARQQTGHMGLIGMAERARELGWALSVQSQQGHGTCIRVEQQNEPVTTGATIDVQAPA